MSVTSLRFLRAARSVTPCCRPHSLPLRPPRNRADNPIAWHVRAVVMLYGHQLQSPLWKRCADHDSAVSISGIQSEVLSNTCLSTMHSLKVRPRGRLLRFIGATQECHGRVCRGKVLPANCFYRDKKNLSGLSSYCKHCSCLQNIEQAQAAQAVPYEAGTVAFFRCTTCAETKPASDYSRDERKRSGLQPRCKQCNKASQRKAYAAKKALVAVTTSLRL